MRAELLNQIKKMSIEEGITEIQATSALQSAAAISGNDEVLDVLCEIKSELIEIQQANK